MNKQERIKVIRAMETLARCVNDEEVFNLWLRLGVADGDIKEDTLDEELEFYAENENFCELLEVFMILMKDAFESGGLYCDRVVSGFRKSQSPTPAEDEEPTEKNDLKSIALELLSKYRHYKEVTIEEYSGHIREDRDALEGEYANYIKLIDSF